MTQQDQVMIYPLPLINEVINIDAIFDIIPPLKMLI